jgi:hypothetical protein
MRIRGVERELTDGETDAFMLARDELDPISQKSLYQFLSESVKSLNFLPGFRIYTRRCVIVQEGSIG